MHEPLPELLRNDNLIAHYTKAETAIEHILPTNLLRFSALTKTNDPKENLERSIDINCTRAHATDLENIHQLASESYKTYTRISCFARAKEGASPYRFSFFRTRMWAQYAQNNQGVCLLFERDTLFRTIKKQVGGESLIVQNEIEYLDLDELYHLYPHDDLVTIDYERIKTLGVSAAIRENIKANSPTFFRKDSDWSGEQEYRVLVFDPRLEGEYAYYDLEQSLKAVILGTRFNPKSILRMQENLPKDVALFQLKLEKGKYTVSRC